MESANKVSFCSSGYDALDIGWVVPVGRGGRAWAQTRPLAKGAAARVDNCAPIGRTEDGKLVYSMKCENLPAPPPETGRIAATFPKTNML